jgi:putative ABC transport system ATP-binding protein
LVSSTKTSPALTTQQPSVSLAIEASHVDKRIKLGERELHIIKDVSFDVPKGQMLAIVGPSGSGKSTLMGMLGGLDTPTSGNVFLDSVDIAHLNEVELTKIRNEKIGFVFQFFHLIPTLNAIDNVALPIRFAHQTRYEPETRAVVMLELLGLGDRLKHRPGQLSGGQQQRVAIARAMANDPPILLCDEPTGNLDTTTGQQIMTALREVQTRMDTTVIIVTHDPSIAMQTERVLTLVDGRIVEDRTV